MKNFILLATILSILSCQENANEADKAKLWAANKISTEAPEFASTFNADETAVYFNRTADDRSTMQIMYAAIKGGA